jgi:hypothetical protein
MDTGLLFGFLFGLTIVPIALAAVLGEWLNEHMQSRTELRAWAMNLASWVRHGFVRWSRWRADVPQRRARNAPLPKPEPAMSTRSGRD